MGRKECKLGKKVNTCRRDLGPNAQTLKYFTRAHRGFLTFFILKDSSSRRSTARMFSMGMLQRAPSPGGNRNNIRHGTVEVITNWIVMTVIEMRSMV